MQLLNAHCILIEDGNEIILPFLFQVKQRGG